MFKENGENKFRNIFMFVCADLNRLFYPNVQTTCSNTNSNVYIYCNVLNAIWPHIAKTAQVRLATDTYYKSIYLRTYTHIHALMLKASSSPS